MDDLDEYAAKLCQIDVVSELRESVRSVFFIADSSSRLNRVTQSERASKFLLSFYRNQISKSFSSYWHFLGAPKWSET